MTGVPAGLVTTCDPAGGTMTGVPAGRVTTCDPAGGTMTGVPAGRVTTCDPVGGMTTVCPAGLGTGLTKLRGGPGLILPLSFTTTTVGFKGRKKRPRPGMRVRPTGRFPSTFCGSASTTQARATRARSTCRTESKLLVCLTVPCCSSAEYT